VIGVALSTALIAGISRDGVSHAAPVRLLLPRFGAFMVIVTLIAGAP